MTKPLELLPAALDEVEADAAWYRERDPRLARAFVAEVQRAVALIKDAPHRWPRYHHGTQRVLLRKYPYSVVYREEASRILIVAIAHFRKRPAYWRYRT